MSGRVQRVLDAADLVAFVPTRDLEVSARFYGGLLGLPLVESSTFANVYAANGTHLRVTRVDELTPEKYTVLGWRVSDVISAVQELRSAGVEFMRYAGMAQDEHDIWDAPEGSRIAWFCDPDENVLSLQQQPPTGPP